MQTSWNFIIDQLRLHVIMECPQYKDIREQLIQGARDLNIIAGKNMSIFSPVAMFIRQNLS